MGTADKGKLSFKNSGSFFVCVLFTIGTPEMFLARVSINPFFLSLSPF